MNEEAELVNFFDGYNHRKEQTGQTDACIEEILEGLGYE